MQVYPLREKGQRLAREVVVERGPIAGELLFKERLARSGIYFATLLVDNAGTYGLPPLDRAALRKVSPSGFMLFGKEVLTRSPSIKSSAEYWPQVWWCVPYSLTLSPPLTTAMVEKRTVPAWQRAIAN